MYLSQLRIKNYRSIDQLTLDFNKGKNVVVGKNNAGKSNIIKAIDLILGEGSPSYNKSENITEKDFHKGKTADPILIFCELTREPNELLNYQEIYKCLGYKYHIENKTYDRNKNKYVGAAVRHRLEPIMSDDFWNQLDALINISDDEVENLYVNPKLQNQQTFEEQLDDKYSFAFIFRAEFVATNKIQKEIRFLYRENNAQNWILAFTAPVRCELLQSAIIPSFRDPSSELRISQWSWYGKLLKNYIDADDPTLKKAFDGLKSASDGVFERLRSEINNTKVKVAFPDTNISFQFNHDTRLDIYKSALIYVDDGFNSLLAEKGSGIQSAVIIGLFHYYTRNIAHASGSLLAIEEPEIYLHPQARRVISNRLDDFLEGGKNQVIITTHSPEFIASAHEDVNIILVRKTSDQGTNAKNTSFKKSKEKQILLKVQNCEMLFADGVILVEGGEKFILESVASHYGTFVKPDLGANWLNDKNISVISVGGKTEFWKYYQKLHELGIKCYVIADFDFFLRKFSEFLTKLDAKKENVDELNAVKSRLGITDIKLKKEILQKLDELKLLVKKSGGELDDKYLSLKLKEPFKMKKLLQLPIEFHNEIKAIIQKYSKLGIHILENELEDFYTDNCKLALRGVQGKEEKPIVIVSQLVNDENPITTFVNSDEYLKVLENVHQSFNS